MEIDNNMEIEMNVDVHKFCVSIVSFLVAEFGLNTVVQTWNSHSIPFLHLFHQEKKCCFTKWKEKLEIQILISNSKFDLNKNQNLCSIF